MAVQSENYDEIAGLLAAACERADGSAQGETYRSAAERFLARLRQGDHSLVCYISVIHVARGAMVVDEAQAECLIVASCERTFRDFMRCVPNGVKRRFIFDEIYKTVAEEYLFRDGLEAEPCVLTGERRSNPSDVVVLNRKGGERFIESKKADVVAEFKKLTTLKARVETGRVVMEGALTVTRALKDNLAVEKVVYADSVDAETRQLVAELCEKNGIAYYRASQGILAAMTTTNPVPDILCSARVRARDESELIISKERNFFLILDGIANPDNLGMVLRTADASGVDAVILLSPSTHHFNKNAIRGARGAVGRIPIYFCRDDFALMDVLREHNFRIWGTSARFSASNFYDMSFATDNIAVIVGNESNGVRREILDRCTDYVKIPMVEGQSSLNIAVAAALVMYEYDRGFYT